MKLWQEGQALDFLVCGLPTQRIDPERPYGSLRGEETRAFGLANNISRLGWQAGLVVEDDFEFAESALVANGLFLVLRSALASAAQSAGVMILAGANLKTLRQRVPEALAMEHPRRWLSNCLDLNDPEDVSSLVRGVVGVSFSNKLHAQAWAWQGLPIPAHVQPFGVDEHNYLDAGIAIPDRPTAIWIGELRQPTQLERIVRFAEVNPECEVRVLSHLACDQRLPSDGQGSTDHPYLDQSAGTATAERFGELMQRWCGRAAPDNLRYMGGDQAQNAELLGCANLALGFAHSSDSQHDASMVVDYLRSGLPVLCDDGQPSCRIVQELGHGCVISFGTGDEALQDGYRRCLAVSTLDQRREIAQRVRDRFGWPAVARLTVEWIQADVGAARESARQTIRSATRAWPELRRECGTFYYEAEALLTPRFEWGHVMEVVHRARLRHSGARLFYLTDTPIPLNEPDIQPLHQPQEVEHLSGSKVFICAFFSDERLAKVLGKIQTMPDAVYLMPRVFVPTARYFHHNQLAHEVLCSEAALPQPKFSLADFENLIQALESTRHVAGDFVEVGVYQGRSAHCALSYLRRVGLERRAWLLDVFDGFTYPEALLSSDAYWAGSHTDTSELAVRQWLAEFPNATVVKANIITDALPGGITSVAVANIDVDMYEAVVAALQRLVPLTVPGSIIVLEDQGHTPPLGGAWLAVKEFLDSPEAAAFTPVHLASGQMFLVRHRGRTTGL